MLAISKITNLLNGKLSDQEARDCLLALNAQTLNADLINEVITGIRQTSDPSLLNLLTDPDIIDCCGTGGSGIVNYNTSTSVAFVLAAGGLKVAKFGNRAASGSSGSVDFLEYLGIPASLPFAALKNIFEITNLAFLFAPQFYPSLVKLAPIRKSLGEPTIFNIIGPLLNPCRPGFRILGTASTAAQKAIAEYLFSDKDNKKSLVVHADSGLDELDPAANNNLLLVEQSGITQSSLSSNKKMEPWGAPSLVERERARIFQDMIGGLSGPTNYFQALVMLNAGAGFFLAGKTTSIEEGQELAANLLSSGAVLDKYEQCRSVYAQFT